MLLPELLATLGLVNPGRHWPSPTAAPARNYKGHWSSQLPATGVHSFQPLQERKREKEREKGKVWTLRNEVWNDIVIL